MFFIVSVVVCTKKGMQAKTIGKNIHPCSLSWTHDHIFINKHNALFQFSKNIAVLQVLYDTGNARRYDFSFSFGQEYIRIR